VLLLFVFPESLDKKRMEALDKGKARASSSTSDAVEEDQGGFQVTSSSANQGRHGRQSRDEGKSGGGHISGFLKPLAVFLPVDILVPTPNGLGRRKKRDWSLTFLAVAMLGFMLSSGLAQIKYLYAVHTYSWRAEQLSYYISFIGGGRAVFFAGYITYTGQILPPQASAARHPGRELWVGYGFRESLGRIDETTTRQETQTNTSTTRAGGQIRFDVGEVFPHDGSDIAFTGVGFTFAAATLESRSWWWA